MTAKEHIEAEIEKIDILMGNLAPTATTENLLKFKTNMVHARVQLMNMLVSLEYHEKQPGFPPGVMPGSGQPVN